MTEMNQNINQLISKLFRGDSRTVTLLQPKNNMKFSMAKQITDARWEWTNLSIQFRGTTGQN